MLFRPDRNRRGPDRFLYVKMALLAIGGLTAVAGFALGLDWLITPAIVILAAGLALNLLRRSDSETEPSDNEPAD